MFRGFQTTLGVLIALLGIAGVVHAQSPVSEITPRWIHDFSREVPATDTIVSLTDRTWVRLPDDDVVLFTEKEFSGYVGASLLVRRFSADGALRQTRIVPPPAIGTTSVDRIIVAYDSTSGDIVVLAGHLPGSGYWSNCRVLRLDGDLDVKASTPLGDDTLDAKACIGMRIAPDGSVIAADNAGLSRIDPDGTVLWRVHDGDAGLLLSPHDMLLDESGVIWVATEGPMQSGHRPAILRFDLDGMLLSSDYDLCDACDLGSARALDLSSDGSVFATGSPGFIARYAPTGEREFVVDIASAASGLWLDHDEHDALYVLVHISGSAGDEVRRIDTENGAELWARPAQDFVATADGIVVTQVIEFDMIGTGFDGSGTQLWSRELQSAPGDVSRGRFVDGRVELLAASYHAEPDCGTAPRLLALDANGVPEVLARPCLMPASTEIGSVDAIPGMGVLVRFSDRLIAYSPDGDVRWATDACPWCVNMFWTNAVLTPDGGAWAIQIEGYLTFTARLARFDAAGTELFSVALHDPDYFYSTPSLFGTNEDAVAVQADLSTLVWQRVHSDTGQVETQSHGLPMFPFDIRIIRRLADGGIGVAVQISPCEVPVCPPRPPPDHLLARLTPNGALAWTTVPAGYGVVAAFDGKGAANVIAIADDYTLHLQRIGVDGNTTVDVALPGVTGSRKGLFGPYAGRLLLASGTGDAFYLWSIDAAGTILASREFDPYTSVRIDSPLGLLI